MPLTSSELEEVYWPFRKVWILPDERYENERVIVQDETPLQVSWCPSQVLYNDLRPEIQRLVRCAWKSPHRRKKLEAVGQKLENENAWSCTVSLVSWQRRLEYKVSWKTTDEKLSNLSPAARKSLVAQLEADQYRVVKKGGEQQPRQQGQSICRSE